MSWLFGGPSAHIDLQVNSIEGRKPKYVDYGEGAAPVACTVFEGDEDITGTVEVHVPAGKALEHQAANFEKRTGGRLCAEFYYDRSNPHEFTHDVIPLEPAGTISGVNKYTFKLPGGSRTHESYNGINVRTRYFVSAMLQRSSSPLSKEEEVVIQTVALAPAKNPPIHMEVGIEECLHIEFTYDKESYHLSDVVTGRINFLLVRIKVKHLELTILRREKAGNSSHVYNESDTVTKFEVMDGAPVRGEVVPVRLYLSGFDLTPTYANVAQRYSVRYYLNLVLIDEQDRRYFKQHEIKLWRKKIK